MEIFCRVTEQGLVPLYDSDYEEKKRLCIGTDVKVTITQPRNIKFHKKFFALVRMTLDNLPHDLCERYCITNEASMLKRFKHDLGLFESHENEYGEKELEYKSISFASMSQPEFESFYEECVALVVNKYIHGIDQEDIKENIHNFM